MLDSITSDLKIVDKLAARALLFVMRRGAQHSSNKYLTLARNTLLADLLYNTVIAIYPFENFSILHSGDSVLLPKRHFVVELNVILIQ